MGSNDDPGANTSSSFDVLLRHVASAPAMELIAPIRPVEDLLYLQARDAEGDPMRV
jgi:hypothetical protein